MLNANSGSAVPSQSGLSEAKPFVVRNDSAQARQFPDVPKLSNHSPGINEQASPVTDFDKGLSYRAEHTSESVSDRSTVVAVPKQNAPENYGDDLTELAYKQSKETIAAPKLEQLPVSSPMLADSIHSATQGIQHREEDQPPLPTNLGVEDDVAHAPKQPSSSTTLPLATTTAIPNIPNELPPLPPDVSTSATSFAQQWRIKHFPPHLITTCQLDAPQLP